MGDHGPLPALGACERDLGSHLLQMLGQNAPVVVSYGSETRLFPQAVMPVVSIGAGNIAQAHQPDEWIKRAQLDGCVALLNRLVEEFCT